MVTTRTLFEVDLGQRRTDLGMPIDVLAKRSGVSEPTVKRILRNGYETVSFAKVMSVANALGIDLRMGSREDTYTMRRNQALMKAQSLVNLVQGTSALEAQAVDSVTIKQMVEETMHKLLSTKKKLWA